MGILYKILFNYISAILLIVFGIKKLRDTLKNTTRNMNNVPINFIALAVFQGDKIGIPKVVKVKAIRFTYENDVWKCRAIDGVTDTNLKGKST